VESMPTGILHWLLDLMTWLKSLTELLSISNRNFSRDFVPFFILASMSSSDENFVPWRLRAHCTVHLNTHSFEFCTSFYWQCSLNWLVLLSLHAIVCLGLTELFADFTSRTFYVLCFNCSLHW
jgi:hypothetical protein